MSSPSALGILPGGTASGRRGMKREVVRVRGLLAPPSQGDHMCQCMRHRGWGATVKRARTLSLPCSGQGRALSKAPSKAPSVFPNVETTKDTQQTRKCQGLGRPRRWESASCSEWLREPGPWLWVLKGGPIRTGCANCRLSSSVLVS